MGEKLNNEVVYTAFLEELNKIANYGVKGPKPPTMKVTAPKIKAPKLPKPKAVGLANPIPSAPGTQYL
mgnify:CR=1 FL=1